MREKDAQKGRGKLDVKVDSTDADFALALRLWSQRKKLLRQMSFSQLHAKCMPNQL